MQMSFYEIHLFGHEPSLVVTTKGLEWAVISSHIPESGFVVLLADRVRQLYDFAEVVTHFGISGEHPIR